MRDEREGYQASVCVTCSTYAAWLNRRTEGRCPSTAAGTVVAVRGREQRLKQRESVALHKLLPLSVPSFLFLPQSVRCAKPEMVVRPSLSLYKSARPH